MKLKIISIILILTICFPLVIFPEELNNSVSVSSISAQAAILITSDDCEVIYSKSPNQKLPMASTTKIMTAILVIENCDLDKVVEIDAKACGVEGSSIYLYAGEKITVRDLLYAIMLESANDASTALAIVTAGSIEKFVQMMNSKAYELGMSDSHFSNPHGLDNEEHYSSAHDMAILTSYALKNKTFREVTSTYKYTSEMNGVDETRVFINHNRLLKTYEGCIGGKTGYTKRSGRCLVSCAMRNGVELICVTLNASSDWNDHSTMLDVGFENYEKVTLAQKGEFSYELPVINGESKVVYATAHPVEAVVKKGSTDDLKVVCELDRFYYADVSKGELLGNLVFYADNKEIARSEIRAQNTVKSVIYKNIFQKLLDLFKKN